MTDIHEKTVYLLGAGASANTMPVAEKLPDDMIFIAGKVAETFPGKSGPIVEGIRTVAEKAKEHGSVDRYAYDLSKVENHSDTEEYLSLRFMLTAYMLLKHVYNAPALDKRYRMWLDSVRAPKKFFSLSMNEAESYISMKGKQSFLPENVVVLTYNYDFQMEVAFYQMFLRGIVEQGLPFFSAAERWGTKLPVAKDFADEMPLDIFGINAYNTGVLSDGITGSLPTVCYRGEIKEFSVERKFYASNWSCFHLNGVCDTNAQHEDLWGLENRTAARKMMREWDTFHLPETFLQPSKEEYITHFLNVFEKYETSGAGYGPCLNLFGWDLLDKTSWGSESPSYLEQKISGAKNLVVIGYSFPDFNRWMDQGIFNCLGNAGALKRVYIQNPNAYSIPGILRRAIGQAEIIPLKDTEKFFIPDTKMNAV